MCSCGSDNACNGQSERAGISPWRQLFQGRDGSTPPELRFRCTPAPLTMTISWLGIFLSLAYLIYHPSDQVCSQHNARDL